MKPRSALPRMLRRSHLSLERLEERETPAGVVAVAATGISLTFTGDGNAAGNEVRVTTTALDQFLIEGLGGTTFTIGGVNVGATIDTSLLPGFLFPNNGTTTIKGTFLGGPDRFEYNGTAFNPSPPPSTSVVGFGDVTLNMGAGNDTVILRQFVAKNLTINSTAPTGAATDNDTITVLAGGVFDFDGNLTPETYLGGLRGSLTFNGQTGNDTVTLALTAAGSVKVALKDSNDLVEILGASRIGGSVTVTETATTVLGTTTFSVRENSNIGKFVTLTNPTNAAVASVLDSTIGGNVTLSSGSGVAGSTFNLTNSTIGGAVAITGGILQDSVTATDVTVGKTLTMKMGNGGNGAGDSLTNVNVVGNVTATYGTGNDVLSIQDSALAGSLTVTGGEGQDRFIGQNLAIAKALTMTMGNGGNGAGDSLINVDVCGAVIMNYGTANGDDTLNIQDSTFAVSATINAAAGLDRLTVQNSSVGLNFSYTGGLGGSGVGVNQDLISNVTVGGTFRVTYGAGNEDLLLTNSTITGTATIIGGGGSDLLALTNLTFLGALSVTGGLGADTVNLTSVSVGLTTALTTSGGDDTLNIAQSGRFKGKVTINTGGTGSDLDTITIEAAAANEIAFLGGISIVTGPNPTFPMQDSTTIGTQAGQVLVLNGFTYADAAALLDNVNIGPNLLIL